MHQVACRGTHIVKVLAISVALACAGEERRQLRENLTSLARTQSKQQCGNQPDVGRPWCMKGDSELQQFKD